MKVEELVTRRSAWLDENDPNSVVVSNRVRLARNISGEKFPARMSDEERLGMWNSLRDTVSGVSGLQEPTRRKDR